VIEAETLMFYSDYYPDPYSIGSWIQTQEVINPPISKETTEPKDRIWIRIYCRSTFAKKAGSGSAYNECGSKTLGLMYLFMLLY
jgi:hypothetical protein